MDKYGLIGRTLGHSFSKSYFTEKFDNDCLDCQYLNFELPTIDHLPGLLEHNPDLKGFNVTIPYKSEIMEFMDRLSPTAAKIGAVNTVAVERCHGREKPILVGHNTDCEGFRDALEPLIAGRRVGSALVLGSGGASKAVVVALRQLGIAPTIVSRTPTGNQIGYSAIDAATMGRNLLIVNATPLGTWPDVEAAPPIPYELLTPAHTCFDLVYNPDVTNFMAKSKERGATVANGLAMLHRQAEASWLFWQKIRFETD